MCPWLMIVDIRLYVVINGAYRRYIEKHYVGFDLSLVSCLFAAPSPLKRYFARSFSDR